MWTASKTISLSIAAAASGAVTAHSVPWVAEPLIMVVCAVGIPIGILARVAVHIEDKRPPDAIRRDLWVSLMLALSNYVLALSLSSYLHLSPIVSLAVAIGVAASGSMAILAWVKRIRTKLWPAEDIALLRQQDQRIVAAVHAALKDRDDRGEMGDKE